MKPELLRQLELVAQERPSLSSTSELRTAGKQANEEQKVLQKSTFKEVPDKSKGYGKDWKQDKGEKGGKYEKGKKGKGEGKKK